MKSGIAVSLGLASSSDFGSLVEEEYGDVSGYTGMIVIEAAMPIRLLGMGSTGSSVVQLVPRLKVHAGRLQTVVSGFESSPNQKALLAILPGLAIRYRTPIGGGLSGYAALSIYRNSIGNDLTRLGNLQGGTAYSVSLGLGREPGYGIEIGYIAIPVSLDKYTQPIRHHDLGGLFVTLNKCYRIR
jgi:hypothetical protein